MEFSLIEVVKTKENFHYVEWDLTVTVPGESIDDYKFQIHWAEDPSSGFLPVTDEHGDPIEIDGAIGPLAYTHQLRQYDFNRDMYYKVYAILKINPLVNFFSSTVFIGMYSDGVHETMRHAEDTLYTMYHGEPCLVIKRKSFGARCPTCWSAARQQRMRTHCDTCKGTGFVTGYYQPLQIQISFDSDPRKNDVQKEWENSYDTKRVRASNYPLLRPKDLIVNLDDNKRYVIVHNDTTKLPKMSESKTVLSKQNYILSQLLTLEELNPNDNEYFIDTDHIPEIPISDEGQTGSTLPFFNDHKPVTVDAPLEVDDQQHVTFDYSHDHFEVVSGQFRLKNQPGMNVSIEDYTAGVIIGTLYKTMALMNDGKVEIANHTNASQVERIVGINLTTAALNAIVKVQNLGRLTNPAWSWEIGKGVFFDSTGSLTQDPQLTGFWQNIGQAISPTTIYIMLKPPVLRAVV